MQLKFSKWAKQPLATRHFRLIAKRLKRKHIWLVSLMKTLVTTCPSPNSWQTEQTSWWFFSCCFSQYLAENIYQRINIGPEAEKEMNDNVAVCLPNVWCTSCYICCTANKDIYCSKTFNDIGLNNMMKSAVHWTCQDLITSVGSVFSQQNLAAGVRSALWKCLAADLFCRRGPTKHRFDSPSTWQVSSRIVIIADVKLDSGPLRVSFQHVWRCDQHGP